MSDETPPERRTDKTLREVIDNLAENPFGIITQRGYQELERKIDDYANEIENRFHKWLLGGIIAFAVIGLACTTSLVGFGVLLTNQGNATHEIQQQRYTAVLDSCLDQNVRHDNVIAAIDEAVAQTPKANRKRAKESAGPFKLILEAAVPYTMDCRALARNRVKGE